MASAISLIGGFLLLGGGVVLAACLFPGYRARHAGRARWAGAAALLGFVAIVAAGQLMLLSERDQRASVRNPVTATPIVPAAILRAPLAKPGNSPIERHPAFVIPLAFLLGLVMTTAMLELSGAFLVRQPPRGNAPIDPDELSSRLRALKQSGVQYHIVPGRKCDLELEWDVVDTSWHNLFSKIKLSSVYHARMLFVPARHEVRWCEWLRTSDFFIGLRGWTLVLNFAWQFQVGYLDVVWKGKAYGIQAGFPPRVERIYDFSLNTVAVKREISDVVAQAGWTFRPVIFWFQAGRSWLSDVSGARPTWPETRVWGLAAAVSYFLFLGYLMWMVGGYAGGEIWTRHNLVVIAAVTVGWWGLWGVLTWVLVRAGRSRVRHA